MSSLAGSCGVQLGTTNVLGIMGMAVPVHTNPNSSSGLVMNMNAVAAASGGSVFPHTPAGVNLNTNVVVSGAVAPNVGVGSNTVADMQAMQAR